jgi:hypothetical protein
MTKKIIPRYLNVETKTNSIQTHTKTNTKAFKHAHTIKSENQTRNKIYTLSNHLFKQKQNRIEKK